MEKLQQHEVFVLARNKAWTEYNRSKMELDEMLEIYNHTFMRDMYIEQMLKDLERDIQVWNFIFTKLEKMLPHDPQTTDNL